MTPSYESRSGVSVRESNVNILEEVVKMRVLKSWQSRTALFLSLGLSSAVLIPFTVANAVQAIPAPYLVGQRFPNSWRSSLPSGTPIPVEYEEAERILLTPDETVEVTLDVAANVLNSRGAIIIPAGSQLEGDLQPQGNGSRFVAQTLILPDGTRRDINAVSNVVTERETISERDNPDILRGAAIGGAAAAVLSEIFGSIDVLEVLAGAGVGVLAEVLLRDKEEVEVVVVRPEELQVRLQSDFVL